MAAGSTMLLSLLIKVREEGAHLLGKMRAELQEVAAANPQLARSSALVGQSLEATAISASSMVSQLGLVRQRGAELFESIVHGSLGAAAAVYAFKKSFLDIAVEEEQMRNRMEALERTPGRAESAMAWLEEFRSKTGSTFADNLKAYIELRDHGINPLIGRLQAVADAAAALGRPMAEMAREFGEAVEGHGEGRFRELGINIQKSKSQLNAFIISWEKYGKVISRTVPANNQAMMGNVLDEAIEDRAGGAAAKAAGSFTGRIRAMQESWNTFAIDVMTKGGVFTTLKEQLASLVDDGKKGGSELTDAELSVSEGLKFIIIKLGEGAKWLKDNWPAIKARLKEFVDYIGGWKAALLGVIGIMALPFIASLLGAVYTLGVMTLAIGTATLALMRFAVVAIGFLIRGLVAASAALLATPFGWLLVGAVAVGLAIWWLATHWDTATKAMSDAWSWLRTQINWDFGMQRLHEMVDNIAAIFTWLGDHMQHAITTAIVNIRAAVDAVQKWLPSWAGGTVATAPAAASGAVGGMAAGGAGALGAIAGSVHVQIDVKGDATGRVTNTTTSGPFDLTTGLTMAMP